MLDSLPAPGLVPQVIKVVVNEGLRVYGSFIEPEWVWHYIHAGKWEFRLESRLYRVCPGDMVLLPPRLLHAVRPLQSQQLVQWVVHFEWPGSRLRSPHFPFVVVTPPSFRPWIGTLFSALQEEWQQRRPQYKTIAGGLVMALIGLHYRHNKLPRAAGSQVALSWNSIENVITYIQENYARSDVSLPEIARTARLSPNYLCRVFKRCLGVSVMHYLAFYRIQKAEELLIDSTLNCSEIANEVGFASVHQLSRIFRKFKKMPPTVYRQTHRI